MIQEFLKKNREKTLNIHVVGDAMVDEYYKVKVNRISPEFPMPIMLSDDNNCVKKPGGAANVVLQMKNFNVDCELFCFDDKSTYSVFEEHNINLNFLLSNEQASLPIKKRFLDDNVQIIRHDVEKPLCGMSLNNIDTITGSLFRILNNIKPPDVAIFSDYDKGFFESENFHVKDLYYKNDVITIVDPKENLDKWVGCTIMKPNAKEAQVLTGRSSWEDQAKHIVDKTGCKGVAITFGGEKVAGIWKGDLFCYKPSKSVNVQSVIGAGDCFCAVFSMAIGHGFELPEAAELAWNAGSIYVQNLLNRPIVPAELSSTGMVDGRDLSKRDFKLVFTNGCFDILHEGHLESLRFAKSQGDKLVVALNSDDSVKRLKGPERPIKSLDQRMKVMASLEMVDFVVSFDEDTPLNIIKDIKPDVLVKGGNDYFLNNTVGSDIVPLTLYSPHVVNLSTTNLLNKF